jgi:hypothetical protein
MTPEQFKRLPQAFKAKIEADENLADFRQDNILDMKAATGLLRAQRLARTACKRYIKPSSNDDKQSV